ncbi:MAG: hypothetical protein AAB490_00565, partial [Patescibacteria group bacterium]
PKLFFSQSRVSQPSIMLSEWQHEVFDRGIALGPELKLTTQLSLAPPDVFPYTSRAFLKF